jgi:FAD/FMN-containing dehydrogenase
MSSVQIPSLPAGAIDREHPDYDEARMLWNADPTIQGRPLAILRCGTVDEVQAAVRLATAGGLPLAVRCGGHSFPGHSVCDDGILIDLAPLNAVIVDPEKRTVEVGGGALLGDVDAAAQAHGLAVPAGIVSHTGVGGLTLGGGVGYLQRLHGLTCDNLLSAELVDFNGDVIEVDAESHPDLFWGLRGGGGNFGIVTKFAFRAHPVGPEIVTGWVAWPFEQAADVLRMYREQATDAPRDVLLHMHLWPAGLSGTDLVPEELWGRGIIVIRPSYFGPIENWEQALETVRSFGAPLMDTVGPASFLSLQSTFDDLMGHGENHYMKAANLRSLDDGAIAAIVTALNEAPNEFCEVEIFPMGGAVADVPADASAFGDRSFAFLCECTTSWQDPEDREISRAWSRALHESLEEFSTGLNYMNMLFDANDETVSAAYGAGHWDRLREIKRRYDPENVFRLNPNVPPTEAPA